MNFFEVVTARHSIRRFHPGSVEPRKLTQILETANLAPSAGNLQAYQIFVVSNPKLRQSLARAAGNQDYVAEAPVVLVFCADPARSTVKYGSRGEQLYCVQDATIACAYAQLAATALGLGSVWVGAIFEPEAVQEALGITRRFWPVALLPIGYAAETPVPAPRRALSELVEAIE